VKRDAIFLRSRVARRVFLLFIICALLPSGTLAVISFGHVTHQLYEQSQKRVRQASKAIGMAIYERLLLLEAEMGVIASTFKTDTAGPARMSVQNSGSDLERRFTSLAVIADKASPVRLLGDLEGAPKLSADQMQHIRSGKTLVVTDPRSDSGSRLFMIRALDLHYPGRGVLVAEINGTHLWGIGDEVTLPPMTDLCVLEESRIPLVCSFPKPVSLPEQLRSHPNPSDVSFIEWQDAEEDYLTGLWSIPMKFKFFAPTWTVALSETKSEALAPIKSFAYTFVLVILLSLWLVSLASLRQIRSSLVPLEKLQEGTRRMASADFTTRVTISSGDEFEDLAASFNSMAFRLGRQFETLSTIGEIDRAVLSALDHSRIIEAVLVRMQDVFPCDGVSITLLDSDGPGAVLTYHKEADAKSRTLIEPGTFSDHEIQMVRDHPDHLFLTGREAFSVLAPLVKRGAASFLILPLFRSERVLGTIALGYSRTPSHCPETLAYLRQVAHQVSVALANAHDLAERKRVEAMLHDSNSRLERTLDELKATQAQMIQQERLRALGEMASGIAHDFNNTLTPILGFSKLLLLLPDILDDKQQVTEHARMINTAARDAAKLVSRLREFYRPLEQDERLAAVDLNQIVEHTIKLCQPKWKDQALSRGVKVQMNAELQPVLPVAGNESELREVITNLIFNAVDALSQSGTITLRTYPEGEDVMLEVSDSGTGMTEEVRQRCLEPFFS
jgi:signal transduction histidine kinase